jgi:hypothetical protein
MSILIAFLFAAISTPRTVTTDWVASIMDAERATYAEAPAGWAESYDVTAAAIAQACKGGPLAGGGADWCASVLVVMGWHESRYNPDAEGDSKSAAGVWQSHALTLGRPIPKDVPGQAEAALELLSTSFRICGAQPLDERLGWYARGGLGCSRRLDLSRFRMHEAARLLRAHPFTPASS